MPLHGGALICTSAFDGSIHVRLCIAGGNSRSAHRMDRGARYPGRSECCRSQHKTPCAEPLAGWWPNGKHLPSRDRQNTGKLSTARSGGASAGHCISTTAACRMPSGGVGALLLGPRPNGGLALVVGGDRRGRCDAVAAGEPTIPPPWLGRPATWPFYTSNTLPAFVVVGPEFWAKGCGGLLSAGFFDNPRAVSPDAWFAMLCVTSSARMQGARAAARGRSGPSPPPGRSRPLSMDC
jgi:hypothetical protein